MPTINQLNAVDTISAGDLLALYSQNGGDARKMPLSQLLAFVQANTNIEGTKVTQYSAPSATGFTVAITNADAWLVLTPTGTLAEGTITLYGSPTDRCELLVNTTQEVTTLTVSGNGATVTGAPSTLAANGFFRLRYDAVLTTWYRVG